MIFQFIIAYSAGNFNGEIMKFPFCFLRKSAGCSFRRSPRRQQERTGKYRFSGQGNGTFPVSGKNTEFLPLLIDIFPADVL